MNKEAILEGLLFVVGDEGLNLEQITEILGVSNEEAREALANLRNRYQSNEYGIQISFLGDTFKLTTKKEHKDYYKKLIETPGTNYLSQAALETLAIIAYKEPISVPEVESIRGVGSREIIRKLIAKGFLKEVGKSDSLGRPTLYATTSDFLDFFGLATKEELPKIDLDTENITVSDMSEDLYNLKYKEEEV